MSNINPCTLESKFIYYTECQLATLEALKLKKRTPKCDLQRQQNICDGMMEIVRELTTEVQNIDSCSALWRTPRVRELLNKDRKTKV